MPEKFIFLLVLIAVLSTSCSRDDQLSLQDFADRNRTGEVNQGRVETLADLRIFLDRRYRNVKELPVILQLRGGEVVRVPFRYRLGDGREFEVPVMFTESGEAVIDPDFDLNSLPR